MSALKFALVVLALQSSAVVWAQDLANDPANCTLPGWDWASNSYGHNPCVVAGKLEAPCRGLFTYHLTHLNGTDVYLPPSATEHPECECNTVIFSLFQACTACQNHTLTDWTKWEANCPSVYVTQYPGVIPSDTAVPHWAYLNWTTGFDPLLAQAAADFPESTATPIPTASVPPASSSSLSSGEPGVATPTPPPATTSGSSKSNTGAIAGGVVGGVVGLGLIAGLIAWLVVRQRRADSAKRPVSDYVSQAPSTSGPYSPGPYNDPQMKVYSPNDPSTFPTSDHLPSLYTSRSPTLAANQPGRYSGVAEL